MIDGCRRGQSQITDIQSLFDDVILFESELYAPTNSVDQANPLKTKLFEFFRRVCVLGADFSDIGFVLRIGDLKPDEWCLVPSMWIGKMGWRAGVNKNIIRCYSDGFSFWNGEIEDDKEWYCSYDYVIGFKKPLGILLADPIVTVNLRGVNVDCMLGES